MDRRGPLSPNLYGSPPFGIVVVHGGPGAPGTMAPVARELAHDGLGVVEPLQSAWSVSGQVEELRVTLGRHATPPVAVVGASWGAWLGLLLAARYPSLVRKLVLVGSGPFDERSAAQIMPTRLARLSTPDRRRVEAVMARLETASDAPPDLRSASPAPPTRNAAFAELGALISKADAYAAVDHPALSSVDVDAYEHVWPEAAELRRTGQLLELAAQLRCPVVAIHGDHDPHPAEGVREPLARVVRDFRFVLLERCGHEPWTERYARDRFFEVLRTELA